MSNPVVSQLLASDHLRRLTADAAQRRLVTLASCCRPSRLAAAVGALRSHLTAGQRSDGVCCA